MFHLKRSIAAAALILTLNMNSAAFADTSNVSLLPQIAQITELKQSEQILQIGEVRAPNSGALLGVYMVEKGKLALVNQRTGLLYSYVLLPELGWLPMSFLMHLGFGLPTSVD